MKRGNPVEIKTSVKAFVYDNIYDDILAGVYPVNSILNERNLVEKYGVSKTPVREALVQLCSEGILQNIPRYGYQLTMITPREIYDMCDFRAIIEAAALERTIQIITEDQTQQLYNCAQKSQGISEELDIRKHWSANMEYHLLLCSFCKNTFIYEGLKDTLKFCSRGAIQYFNKSWGESKSTNGYDHMELAIAIKNKDLDKAKIILLDDIAAVKNTILG